MSVRAGETVSRQCPRRESYFSMYVERLSEARCARRRISRLKLAHGREMVSAQCPRAGDLFQYFSIRLNARDGRPGHDPVYDRSTARWKIAAPRILRWVRSR